MRKKLLKFLALSLAFVLCVPTAGAARRGEEMVRVGLAYGSGALVGANLENNTGYGSGYRFGYFDEDLRFEELGETDEKETQITVLKAQNTWFYYDRSSGKYIYSNSDNGGTVVGCFHLLIDSFRRFDDAAEEAEEYDGGFVAWIDGEYQVRVGAYLSKEDALDAADELGEGEVVGTSAYAVTVIQTGTDRVLFQFDGGEDLALGIMPDVTGEDEVRTWFQGYKYHGGFRYERIGGGDLTVVSVVDMETYIKGVIPFEMSNDWPLEALKAQAVCARTYAWRQIQGNAYSTYGAHVDDSTNFQVYNNTLTFDSTDTAVNETFGQLLEYNGDPIEAFYYSTSDGHGTDGSVWGADASNTPYLRAVTINNKAKKLDLTSNEAFESFIKDENTDAYDSDFPMFRWNTKTTSTILDEKIGGVGRITGLTITSRGAGGYAKTLKVVGTEGSKTFSGQSRIRSILGNVSLVYNRKDGSTSTGWDTLPSGFIYIENNGTDENQVTTFTIYGGGFGHGVGMSQNGAQGMAKQGKTCQEILKFFYDGCGLMDISEVN